MDTHNHSDDTLLNEAKSENWVRQGGRTAIPLGVRYLIVKSQLVPETAKTPLREK